MTIAGEGHDAHVGGARSPLASGETQCGVPGADQEPCIHTWHPLLAVVCGWVSQGVPPVPEGRPPS